MVTLERDNNNNHHHHQSYNLDYDGDNNNKINHLETKKYTFSRIQ
jgi:hypothetical protein